MPKKTCHKSKSVPIVPGGGNSGTPPDNKEDVICKKNSQGIHWFFTWNNYPKDWFQLCQISEGWQEIKKYIMGEEVAPTTGTPHIQGQISLYKKLRFTDMVARFPKGISWQNTRKLRRAEDYCLKDGNWKTNWVMQRPIVFKEKFDMPWQIEILELLKTEPDLRTIHWYWADEGNRGKSRFLKYLCAKHKAVMVPAKKADSFHTIAKKYEKKQEPLDLIIMDIPRADIEYINYGAIEAIKNGNVISGKYEGCHCLFAEPHVIIFANEPPIKEKMSLDRWHIVEIPELIVNSGGAEAPNLVVGGEEAKEAEDYIGEMYMGPLPGPLMEENKH